MNRRNFFKVVTGFVAGIFAGSTAKSKSVCRPKSGQPGLTEVSIREYLRENYIYWGNDSNNIESYFHLINGKYTMVPIDSQRSCTRKLTKCDGGNGTLCPRCKFNDYRCYPAYMIYPNGSIKLITNQEFYKTV